MRRTFLITPWVILIVPFIVLAFFYDSIDEQVLLMRSFIGNQATFAPKSFFTVFRVPLIEIVCAAAIETMRARAANSVYLSMWNILLYTVALKSLFQVFEFVSAEVYFSPSYADLFFYITFATVVCGICLAMIKGRKAFFNRQRTDWEASLAAKIFLSFLLASYLILAILPAFVF